MADKMEKLEELKNTLRDQTKQLKNLCLTWRSIVEEKDITEDIVGEINVAIGSYNI